MLKHQLFNFDNYSPHIDNFIRKYVWKIAGLFVLIDSLVILATPNSAIQGVVVQSTGVEWFSYVYGSFAFMLGVTAIAHKERQVSHLIVFFFYFVHTLLVAIFLTLPSIVDILTDISTNTFDNTTVSGLASLLKYAALCLFIFLYEDSGLLFSTEDKKNSGHNIEGNG